MTQQISDNPYLKDLGLELLSMENGTAEVGIRLQEQHMNSWQVMHGGIIMNIMEEYADEERSFYDWHVKNGKGYEVEIDPELWKKGRQFLHMIREL